MYAPAIERPTPLQLTADDWDARSPATDLVIDEFDRWTLSDALAQPCGPWCAVDVTPRRQTAS
ncbi:MAG TPA: hypothetical protein DGT23_06285 [Micromonosporaceae bacterium]|nr:hypothetical protein [Micromonosporaceae bacterium]